MRNVLILCLLPALEAEIIDRIAVRIGKTVVTESELRRQTLLSLFPTGDPTSITQAQLRDTADRIVELALIRREMQLSRQTEPSLTEATAALQDLRKRLFPDEAQYHAALARFRITEEDLKQHLLAQIAVMRFISVRFRPAVQLAPGELDAHLRKRYGDEIPPGTAARALEDELIELRVNDELDRWLRQAKSQTFIEYHPGVMP